MDGLQEYYARGEEDARLRAGAGLLELLRTEELVRRYLPEAPASVVDIGGATGAHARWLARDGYQVYLVDPVELHVSAASAIPGVRATLGDARALDAEDGSYGFALMCGPLYHLLAAEDRAAAWREARRVVRPGGHVAAATISRFAALHDGLHRGLLADNGFREMVGRDLATGVHRPPEGSPFDWFTETYFHHPAEAAEEARAAGLTEVSTFAIEGTGWLIPHAELDARLREERERERLLWALRQTETEPSVLGASAHLLTVGRS
ncbi:hypothetical protein GCM10010174_91520 [Kutzneria viridogrisea]|uniref:Methyltransferase domain-containing protein n=2 Tax=Kutzneria TaxID=43356 RepID=W5VY41_9PSEU|nr:class I SAM-dependent methyltransferase [Kutzneria albida]AHH93793.1 hypothetical protein KALB_416 [Kutzneria albida DSM 43870]MBA8931202.1 SAM-dependent methyltransferase [Kutzneria viridogrisea]